MQCFQRIYALQIMNGICVASRCTEGDSLRPSVEGCLEDGVAEARHEMIELLVIGGKIFFWIAWVQKA